MHGLWLVLAAQGNAVDVSALAQYGAVGFLAAVALWVARLFYNRLVASWTEQKLALEKAFDLEKARADRLEEELLRLNSAMQNQYITALNEANKAVADALSRMRGGRSG